MGGLGQSEQRQGNADAPQRQRSIGRDLVLGILAAVLIPAVAIGTVGLLLIRNTATSILHQNSVAMMEREGERVQSGATDRAAMVSRFLSDYRDQVDSLRKQADLAIDQYPRLTPEYLTDLYPDKDRAGLPGYGYVHAEHGSYSNWDGKGYGGSVWIRKSVVARVREDAALREEVTKVLGQTMPLVPAFIALHDSRSESCELVWIVTDIGVVTTYPNDYNVRLEQNPAFNDLDESPELYVRNYDADHNPSRATGWTKPYHDAAKLVWMTSCVAPLYDHDRFIGTIGVDVLLSVLTKRLQTMRLSDRGYVFLLSADGVPLALPDEGIVDLCWNSSQILALRKALDGQGILTDEESRAMGLALQNNPDPSVKSLVGRMLGRETGTERLVLSGEERLVGFAPVQETGWSIGVVLPVRDLAAPVDSIRTGLAALARQGLIAFLLSVGVIALISGSLGAYMAVRTSKPVRRLIDTIDQIGRGGDWQEISSGTHDELQSLADSVNRMVRTIREKESRLAAIYDNVSDAIFIHDGKTGAVLDVNRRMSEMFGYTTEEARSLQVIDISAGKAPYSQAEANEMLRRAFEGETLCFEWQARHRNGALFWVEANMSRAEIGDRPCIIVSARDITERKRAEQNIAMMSLALSNIHENAFLLNQDGQFLYVNEESCRALGYTREELLEMSISDLDPAYPAERWLSHWHELQLRRSMVLESELRSREGFTFPVELSANYFEYDGQGYDLVLARDISERKHAAEMLQENERRIRMLADNVPTGMVYQVIVDAANNRRFTYVGAGIEKNHGVTPAQVCADASVLYSQIHEEDLPRVIKAEEESRRTRSPFEAEVRFRAPSGGYRWMMLRSMPRELSNGDTVWDGIEVDITERKVAEETLRASERRLALAIAATSDAIWEWYPLTHQTYYSPRWYEMLGYDNEQFPMTYEAWQTFCHPDDLPEVVRSMDAAVASADSSGYQVEFRMRRRDGSWIWVLGRGNVVQRDDQGRAVLICGTNTDITERKHAAEALAKNEERYRLITELSGQVIYDYGIIDGEVTWAGRVEEITGYALEEFNHRGLDGWRSHVHPDDREALACTQDRALEDRAPYLVKYRYVRQDGSQIQVEDQGAFLYDQEGKAVRMLGSIKDHTAREKAEQERNRLEEQLQQSQKMEAIGRLAGGVAHDFNNLLTAIVGNIQLARLDLDDPTSAAKRLEEVELAAESAASLVRQLLAFSRKQMVEPKVIDLNQLIEGVQRMLARIIGEDIMIALSLGERLGRVTVDPGQFEQVLVNLIVNARDAMPNGGNLLVTTADTELTAEYCESHPDTVPGPYVMLAVTDTGHGMDEETKRRIFEPFFTTKAMGRGTGLGLSTIFGIVKQARGSIDVESSPDRGTTFRIYLPRVEEPATVPMHPAPAQQLMPGHETVLLVEDEDSVRTFTVLLLERLGYTVLCAASGDEALALAEKEQRHIDLLMTDIVMPNMNGRELAEHLLKLLPHLKVLFTSGYTEDMVVHEGVMGANLDFIGKPYSVWALSAKLREILDTH